MCSTRGTPIPKVSNMCAVGLRRKPSPPRDWQSKERPQTMPIASSLRRDLRSNQNLMGRLAVFRSKPFQQSHPHDYCSLQRDRTRSRDAVHDFRVQPTFHLNNWKPRVVRLQAHSFGLVEHTTDQFLSHVVATCTSIQHGLYTSTTNLSQGLTLVS